jgi:zinc protease
MESIRKHTLPNGLKILLKEDHNAPIISHWVWYRVGSRNELPGKTGISHWVEHMLFKGTPRFPAQVMDKAISREGGYWNAFTFLDWTAFFETMPADKIDLAIQLEADRMVNSLFDPDDVSSERSVIISERQGNENEPLFRLGEMVQAEAFHLHNYHHEVIGDLVDLQSIQRDDLYSHYRAFYNPGNAVIAIAGDFEAESMLDKLEQLYLDLPSSPPQLQTIPPEPPQTAERRVSLEGPGETTYIQIGYKVPAATQPDFFGLLVMDSLLSGADNLSLIGDGISNKTSRLYRALVESELAVALQGGAQATIDPYLLTYIIVPHPLSSPEKVLLTLNETIGNIQDTPPPIEELQRAVKQARALFLYGTERITNQAFWLGFSEMFADYSWYETYLDRLSMVTPQDVQRIAQTYLQPQNRVVGIYHPSGVQIEGEA